MNEGRPRLFETDYTIYGEHATRLKFLAKKMPATLTNPTILKPRKFLNAISTFT